MKIIESCRRYHFLRFSTVAWYRFRRYFRSRLQTWDLVQTPVKKSFMVLVDLFPSTKLSQRKFINQWLRSRCHTVWLIDLPDVTSDVNKYHYSLILSHLLVCPSLFTLVFVRAKNLLWWKMWILQRLWLARWRNCTLKAKKVESQTLPLHHLSFSFANDKVQPVLLLDSLFHGFSNAASPVWRFGWSILSRVEIRRGVA